MAKQVAEAPPSLRLAAEDIDALRLVSQQLRHEVAAQYLDFADRCKRKLDRLRWRHIRSQEDIHTFQEVDVPDGSIEDVSQWPQRAMATRLNLRRVLVTGKIPGKLDDVMYGSAFHDSASLRALTDSQCSVISDPTVVATIEEASIDDPFRFCGVAWFTLRFPTLMPMILQRRDCLVLTDARVSTLRNGNRIGTLVSHSIDHPSFVRAEHTPPAIRVTLSLVRICRQVDRESLEFFALHVMHVGGSAPSSIALMASVRCLAASIRKVFDEALRKKLVFIMHDKGRLLGPSKSRRRALGALCDVCGAKRHQRLFAFKSGVCQLCDAVTCPRCSVIQHLITDVSILPPSAKPFIFCTPCIIHVMRLPVRHVAHQELLKRHARDVGDSETASSSFRLLDE